MQSVQKAKVCEITSKWFRRPCLFLERSEEPQPANTQLKVKNLKYLLFPVNCMLHSENAWKGGSSQVDSHDDTWFVF